MEAQNFWTDKRSEGMLGRTCNVLFESYHRANNFLNDSLRNMLVVAPKNQYWAQILILWAAIGGFIYYTFFRPTYYFRDLTGLKADSFFKADVTGVTARQHLISRFPKGSTKINTPMYPNGWFSLCESNMVAKNTVRYIVALGENFAVFRTSAGKVHIVDAYCPHLGANMGVGGKVKNNCLECPFHGWQFDGETGKCTNISYAEKVPDFAKVRTWKSCEINDNIFVWYHAEGEEPTYEIEPIDKVMSGRYWFAGKCEHLLNEPILDIVENMSDSSHHFKVHAPLTLHGNTVLSYKRVFDAVSKAHIITRWKSEDPSKSHESWTRYDAKIRLFDKFTLLTMTQNAKLVGPGYMEFYYESVLGDAVLISLHTPIGPFVTRVTTLLYGDPLAMIAAKTLRQTIIVQSERDFMVYSYRRIDPQANTIKGDGEITQFRRWFGQFFTENSPRFNLQTDTLSW